MPIQLRVEKERQLVVAVAQGAVTVDDFTSYITERVRLGVYDYKQVLDLRDASLQLPRETGLYSALLDARRAAGVGTRVPRTATVARVGTATYGLARQQAIRDNLKGHQFEVFESFEAAEAWLAG